MIQYLLNMTAIWLLGIIVFDIFLRKENYHGYNRWYLLGIMVTGVLFPLWSWDNNSVIYTIGGSTMAEQTNVVRETIVAATTPKVLSWEDIILYMYLGGAFIMLGRLLFELVNIMRLYRTGDKRNYNDHTIIAINKPLSPFSVLKGIYVYQPENYSSEELAMIMAHEQQHGMLYHTIDLMIMRIFQIVFWFHPLVYMLEKRLLMIHEYQADNAIKNNTGDYEKFLVEQSILGTAPILAHSFMHSPLKRRILMMTRKTTALARYKKLVAIPLLMITLICCTQVAQSYAPPQKDGNKITYKGNVIEFGDSTQADTIMVEDPITGELFMQITRKEPGPSKFNGERIYNEDDFKSGSYDRTKGSRGNSPLSTHILKVYLLSNTSKFIKQLEDGTYYFGFGHVILNKDGKIVYYKLNKLQYQQKDGERATFVNDKTQQKFEKAMESAMNGSPKYRPAIYNGKKVHCLVQGSSYTLYFRVKDGKIIEM